MDANNQKFLEEISKNRKCYQRHIGSNSIRSGDTRRKQISFGTRKIKMECLFMWRKRKQKWPFHDYKCTQASIPSSVINTENEVHQLKLSEINEHWTFQSQKVQSVQTLFKGLSHFDSYRWQAYELQKMPRRISIIIQKYAYILSIHMLVRERNAISKKPLTL